MKVKTVADDKRITRIEVQFDQIASHQADHETRIRRVERALWMTAGFVLASGALGAAVAKLIGLA